MTDYQPEVLESGIAVLAESEPTWDDGPFPVRGVFLPEGITTNGNSEGEQVYWPPDVVATVAEFVEGAKITDPSEHDPKIAIERPQPSPETIIGEVTAATYQPGVGVLYEGEVDDPEIAKRIDRGRVDVSPTIFRTLGALDEEHNARIPETIVGVRDLSVVAKGQAEGNSIEPAAVAMSALSASALAAAFDPEATQTTTGAESSTDAVGPSDDGPAGESGQSTTDRTITETMSENDNLTDDQRTLLASAEALDDPMVVESEHAEVLEAAAGCEEPHVVEQAAYESLQDDLGEAKGVFAEVLSERTGMKAETLSALSWEDLRGEFEDDEGNLDAETLIQRPETGQPEGGEETDDEAIAEVLESNGFDDAETATEALQNQYDNLSQAGWDGQAEQVKDDLETLGVEV